MGDKTGISWCDHTFNGWVGCARVSPGCRNCYADTKTARWNPGSDQWRRHGTRKVTSDANWRKPLQWNRAAEQAGERRRVFASSLADVFEDRRDLDEPRARLFALIAKTPHLDWLLLTKRADCIARLAPWGDHWPANVWMGVSVEDQRRADERIRLLLDIPAKVRFLSCEPLLGPLNLWQWLDPSMPCVDCDVCGEERFPDEIGRGHDRFVYDAEGRETGEAWCAGPSDGAAVRQIHWIIAGGESGPKARPMQSEWLRDLREHSRHADIPFHFKQAGNVLAREWGCASRTGHAASEWPEPFPQDFPAAAEAVNRA